tara:strand:+ start:693 stop:890 length:198 start_codon:yes stop_codon:yes gene_type:complete
MRHTRLKECVEQLAKMAQTLAYEGREALDTLGDTDYYLWFIETWGTQKDMERAGFTLEYIRGEEE